ncbi:hypothetical protein FLJC2902T_02910 [Flavobacterium limnosediminis JC2902]|uniref:Deoxyuridine 5'-triphosphate nucleotidohydrolase n=1 Tax=Flavobacterium limnosediminis JC2902 TaxID=1341181 RepID=V6SZH7_9FLAO|nr:hypothetical protein [Flavobacterium limnosediminis]ESU29815.1 hypothetical protein FLJC2902T_02910 [Flavobacterium limnosediminis JC2902]
MFDKEFKTAIQNLSDAEKDKLILRLLKRDLDLANRLYFELVDTETVEQKREKASALVSDKVKSANEHFHSIGVLLMRVRAISGDINEHVKITKDKHGEIALNLQMLIEVLMINRMAINASKPADSYKFLIYVITRIYKILILIKALDEDYLLEFRDDLERLGNLLGDYDLLMRLCVHNGLDVNWLIHCEIPDDIMAYHKELKANGFLK